MKVVSASQMSDIDNLAYQQGFKEADFMEQAGFGISEVIKNYVNTNQLSPQLLLLCGKGNNTGDGLVACSYLFDEGYEIWALQPNHLSECSQLCQINSKRFEEKGGIFIKNLTECPSPSLIIDAIFGTGFKGTIKEPYTQIIQQVNSNKTPILAIDIPSGLNGTTGEIENCAIQATETIFLGLPKLGFFLRNGWNTTGTLKAVDFGLPSSFIQQAQSKSCLLTERRMQALLPPISRSRHKYQAGYVIGVAGSASMPGAALLSSFSALKAGSGIVKLFYPTGMETELSHSPYELIKIPYDQKNAHQLITELNKAHATFIGPGLGRSEETRSLLTTIIPALQKPCVLDADALFFLSEKSFKIPSRAVLTPHFGEMQKLLQSTEPLKLDEKLIDICQAFVEENQTTLVLKGAPTFIFHPGLPVSICPTGDPGMATAGSGDVLTGLIASLLSQGLPCHEAALLGVFLHGLAGEYAAKQLTSYCMTASDLIINFPQAYHALNNY